jgi:predicted TIM-barrel enzyme
MPRYERADLLKKFRAMVARGEPIVGGGAGTGLSAKCEEAGGIDLIVIYNSGRYRMAGRGSLAGLMPYGDANAIVVEMAGEVLPVIRKTPVLAGVNGTDPFRDMDLFLDQLKALGFAGVQNFPTVGLIDGVFRANLEETGMSYALEVAIGAQTALKLEDCPVRIDAWATAALGVNPEILVLAHGGPVAEPADAAFIMKQARNCHGFYGASSMERLPVERALTEQVRKFKAIGGR